MSVTALVSLTYLRVVLVLGPVHGVGGHLAGGQSRQGHREESEGRRRIDRQWTAGGYLRIGNEADRAQAGAGGSGSLTSASIEEHVAKDLQEDEVPHQWDSNLKQTVHQWKEMLIRWTAQMRCGHGCASSARCTDLTPAPVPVCLCACVTVHMCACVPVCLAARVLVPVRLYALPACLCGAQCAPLCLCACALVCLLGAWPHVKDGCLQSGVLERSRQLRVSHDLAHHVLRGHAQLSCTRKAGKRGRGRNRQ